MRVMLVAMVIGWAAVGCGSTCEDLAEICASCPDTADGRQAKASCESTVSQGDELACEDRIDRDIYTPFGCE